MYNREKGKVETLMSKKIFTDKEIEILSKNKYVKSVSIKGITYSD
ncbi:hypothetical protein J2Z76_002551, partial [Sedimentibacter acidaminivorans]|nr:hypothetical protein [Sedimentibacter acidaminivorans]